MLKLGEAYAKSVFFDTGLRWSSLSEKDMESAVYVRNRIHKLPFGVPRGVQARPLHDLGEIICSSYDLVRISDGSLVAYKGGQIERDLLEGLDIPSINLESLGCLKACDLFDDMIWLETCGNHTVINAYAHCAKVEVEAFGQWVENQRKKRKKKKWSHRNGSFKSHQFSQKKTDAADDFNHKLNTQNTGNIPNTPPAPLYPTNDHLNTSTFPFMPQTSPSPMCF